jgi:hypothetical protein
LSFVSAARLELCPQDQYPEMSFGKDGTKRDLHAHMSVFSISYLAANCRTARMRVRLSEAEMSGTSYNRARTLPDYPQD